MDSGLPLDWVLEKTPKGRDELATRSHGLRPGQRHLLILADGNRTIGELVRTGTDPRHALDAMAELLADGYLQRVPETEAQALDPMPHALLIGLVEDLFPAQADRLVQEIEAHPDTPEGHLAAVAACVAFLRVNAGAEQADAFARHAGALR